MPGPADGTCAPDVRERSARTRHLRRRVGSSLAATLLALGVAAPAATSGPATLAADEVAELPRLVGNGHLPEDQLAAVGGVLLQPPAAAAYAAMLEAAGRDGAVLRATDGYRTFERQVALKREKGWLAARPGSSMHGWGLAIDFDMGVTDFAWLRVNAARFGWVHPAWAQPGGSKPEPWHWEYVGTAAALTAAPPRAPEPAEGELVARVRFEPARGPADWFDVHAGLDDLDAGARHYPGTVLPGEDGNFAVAGYQRTASAPLRGLDALVEGDRIRVRTPDGTEHVYEVHRRAQLSRDDGWAVGPDPLEDGTRRLLTLTTASDDGGMTVVWARLVDVHG